MKTAIRYIVTALMLPVILVGFLLTYAFLGLCIGGYGAYKTMLRLV